MTEYGMKATVTAVKHDDDKYEVGFTYSDSDGRAIDKSFGGNMSTIDDDITKALIEMYTECLMSKQKKADQEKEKAVKPSKEESRFAELEAENKRLNTRIAEMMNEKYRHFKNGEHEQVGDKDTVADGNRRFRSYTSNRTQSWSDMRDLNDFLSAIMLK